MYHDDYETTVGVLMDVTTDLIAELPGAFSFFRAFYRHMCGHALKRRHIVTLPQKKWKSFPGAESKPAGGRPLYLLCQQWLTQRQLNGEPLLLAIDNGTYDPTAGRARRYILNLPWCDGEPLHEVESWLTQMSWPNLRGAIHTIRAVLQRTRRRIAEPFAQWDIEKEERFEQSAICAVWHALSSKRGPKPELACQWPVPGYGADIAVYLLNSARAFPHLLISVGWGRDRRDPKMRALKEAGWDERGRAARCQYLSLYSPEPDFLEQAKQWNIDVVALPTVLVAQSCDVPELNDAAEPDSIGLRLPRTDNDRAASVAETRPDSTRSNLRPREHTDGGSYAG